MGSFSGDYRSTRKKDMTLSVEKDWNRRYVDLRFDGTWLVGSSD